eukprot:2712528-Alexandrium_andersonii.AAC.1
MSASLVGSEMCIRDSPHGASGSRRAAGREPSAGRVARRPLGRGARWGGAVSYTHLTLPTICSV